MKTKSTKLSLLICLIFMMSVLDSCDSTSTIVQEDCNQKIIGPSRIKFYEFADTFKVESLGDTVLNNTYFKISVESPAYRKITYQLLGDDKIHNNNANFLINNFKGMIIVAAYLDSLDKSECFKNFKFKDTIYRNLIVKEFKQSSIFGRYLGYDIGYENKQYIVEILATKITYKDGLITDDIHYIIRNLNQGCFPVVNRNGYFMKENFIEVAFANRSMSFNITNMYGVRDSCANAEGIAKLLDKDNIQIDYSMQKYYYLKLTEKSFDEIDDSLRIIEKRTFIGKRIQ